MSETIQLTTTLVIICIISAVTLAVTYEKTNPKIEQNKAEALNKALKEVLDADHFEEINIQTENIKRLFKGLDNNNKVIGLVLLSEKAGFQSYINTLTGIDLDTKKITKTKIIEHLETPGLGARIEENAFLSQFQYYPIDPPKVDAVIKATINAITGATISSTAVIDSVKIASKELLRLIEQGKIEGITFEEVKEENLNTTQESDKIPD